MPDQPNLNHLFSKLNDEQGMAIDHETRRFGFREIWIDGNQYRINGVRVNLRGDNVMTSHNFPPSRFLTREAWPKTIDTLKSMGFNEVRFHSRPTINYLLDIADEKGFLIIEESALYGREYYGESDIDKLIANTAQRWIPQWVTGKRNHPCIVLWSAENEKFMWTSADAPIARLGEAIHKYDPHPPGDLRRGPGPGRPGRNVQLALPRGFRPGILWKHLCLGPRGRQAHRHRRVSRRLA